MSKKISFLAVAVSFFLVCPLFAAQVNSTWTGSASSSWETSANWNPQLVPDNNASKTYAVTITGSPSDARVRITDPHTIDSLQTYGDVDLGVEQWWIPTITTAGGLINYGELSLKVGIRGDVRNTSDAFIEMEEHINIYGDLINDANATLEFSYYDMDVEGDGDGGKIVNNGLILCFSNGGPGEDALFENNGTIQLYSGGSNGDVFDNNTTGTIKGWGGVTGDQLQNKGAIEASLGQLLLHFGSVTNKGLFKNNPGTDLFIHTPGSDVNNQGTIEINAGGSVVCDSNLVNQPSAVVTVKGGTLGATKISQKAGATLEGDGKISGNLVLEINASAALTGPTEIYGDVQIDANAILDINDGTTLIKGHCTCNNGSIHLNGGWLVPQGGLTNINCNIIWQPGLYTNVADFNLDGKVDFKDFANFADTWLWQTQW